jgi:putative oxygen-independent coproporphyrinogen III oxidase
MRGSSPANTVGIYIHVPFCENGKCPYCDFYSLTLTEELKERYIKAVERDLKKWSVSAKGRIADTVYFGGGTPSLLKEDLARLFLCVKKYFHVADNAEVTFEANPAGIDFDLLKVLRSAGFNRLSLGMQSAQDSELAALGRRHRRKDVAAAVENAHRAGFDNISLDLMLCVPNQTKESLKESVDFAASLSPRHISAYLLKIEPGTRFSDIKDSLNLPDEDTQADIYLTACELLESKGFLQYEISNFANKGFESKHNLRYWDCGEYLGFGPAAHSFFNGKRFYYTRSLEDYIIGAGPQDDGTGGTFEEYVMLRLRLRDGINETELKKRYGKDFSCFDTQKISLLVKNGLIQNEHGRLALTRKGFLVSNSIISELLYG